MFAFAVSSLSPVYQDRISSLLKIPASCNLNFCSSSVSVSVRILSFHSMFVTYSPSEDKLYNEAKAFTAYIDQSMHFQGNPEWRIL